MNATIVQKKAVELAFAARVVVEQLSRKDSTPEGMKAAELVEGALNSIFVPAPKQQHAEQEAA